MSIRRLWRSVRRSDSRNSAFTLIELLVVIAIIAVLLSILLPSLNAAREQSRAVVCGQHLRQFGNGLQQYAAENQDWIPGLNTSGVVLRAKRMSWAADIGVLYQSRLPVQHFDWLTPLMAYTMELPAVRAERFKFMLDKFRCPSQFYTSLIWNGSSAPDLREFENWAPWPAVSYLMPVHFQYFGTQSGPRLLGQMEHQSIVVPLWSVQAPTGWEVEVRDYLPTMTRLGAPARKIFVADGTRYLDATQLLDHDVSVLPDWFGSFTSSGAWWSGSRAYGVKSGTKNWDGQTVSTGSPSAGQNMAISYRHGRPSGVYSGAAQDNHGQINAVFFDGHVERLNDRQSRQPHLWYPSGAIVKKPSEGMTNLPMDFVIP